MTDVIEVGDLTFALRRSDRRKTVEVTVERDSTLTIRAPADIARERIEEVARARQEWVYKKLAEKERLAGPLPEKEFVPGESFYYLGRSHRLRLLNGDSGSSAPLRLLHGRFVLRRDSADEGWTHFKRWYATHGEEWIARRVQRLAKRVGVEPVPVEVRDLGYRWGSCSLHGKLNFHWRAVMLPPRIIEYLIVHELVHLDIPDHSEQFWRRVEQTLPEYRRNREWLRLEGGGFG